MTNSSASPPAKPQLRVIEGGWGVREQAVRTSLLLERPLLRVIDKGGYPVMSDGHAWRHWPEPLSASKCHTAKLRGVNRTTGKDWARGMPCRVWGHQPCAVRQAEKKLAVFAAGAERVEAVYFTVVPKAEFVSGRLSDRLRRKREYADDGFFCVKRSDSDPSVWIFATCDLGGIRPPLSMIPVRPEVAMGLCAAALRVPGVERVHRSSKWPEPRPKVEDDRDPTSEMFGIYRDADWEAVLDEAALIARKVHGVEVNVAIPVIRGDTRGWTPEKWIACIEAAANSIRFQ